MDLPLTESWDGGESFTFLNETRRLSDWNDKAAAKLWLYNLHYFDCLRTHPANGEALLNRWIAENPPGLGNGWEPYPLSLRIVNWIKFGVSGDAAQSLAVQLRFLASFPEYHLLANHLLANAKALILGGAYFSGPEADAWSKLGWGIYRRQLPAQILADGGHFERSLMYHSIILEDLLDVYQATGERTLAPFIAKMLGFLVQMTGPDGRIALFNDAAFGIAPAPSALLSYAKALGFAPPATEDFRDFPETGYCRMSHRSFVLFADAAPIGPDCQLGHAHADTLSFELFHEGRRIIVDGGTSCYRGPRRALERGTAAHNTVMADGRDSSEVWGSHRVGRRARIVERRADRNATIAAHDGYGSPLRRSWRWLENGLEIIDECQADHEFRSFLHFAPGCILEKVGQNEIQVDGRLAIKMKDVELLPDGWACEFGKVLDSWQAVSTERSFRGYHNIITIREL